MPSDIISFLTNLALTSSHSECIKLQLQHIRAAKLRGKRSLNSFLSPQENTRDKESNMPNIKEIGEMVNYFSAGFILYSQ